jgi:hypothetical protein
VPEDVLALDLVLMVAAAVVCVPVFLTHQRLGRIEGGRVRGDLRRVHDVAAQHPAVSRRRRRGGSAHALPHGYGRSAGITVSAVDPVRPRSPAPMTRIPSSDHRDGPGVGPVRSSVRTRPAPLCAGQRAAAPFWTHNLGRHVEIGRRGRCW